MAVIRKYLKSTVSLDRNGVHIFATGYTFRKLLQRPHISQQSKYE
jgi:hypothetical protein